ncbi:hypothetical protein [Nitrospira sp. KM1]|uniref:hypothetical protein n=1 Tax=Nitrospira sp. KM1 TaxID=1936990 RepID=UPI0015667DCE|nr:hypothetical protein [Nitrospira sp. KM1]
MESTWFVQLDRSRPSESAALSAYNHPFEWTEPEMTAILTRLLLERETGILHQRRDVEPIFSEDEVSILAPVLRTAFTQATPAERVSFALLIPSDTKLAVTSGALYVKDRRLHIILANSRERLDPFAADIELVRKNPLRPVRQISGRLTFDPPEVVIENKQNWAGHGDEPASEVMLNNQDIQELVKDLMPAATENAATPEADLLPLSASSQDGGNLGPSDPGEQIRQLRSQIESLTRQVRDQEGQLLQLKRDVETLRGQKKNKAPGPPAPR